MELRHLRYFVTVAQELSVTRAAQILHISQPALSRQIRDLENEIGVKLLERTPNSISLTEAGKFFLNEAKIILRRTEDAVEKLRLKARAKKNILRIGFAASPTVEILNLAMQIFQKQHPSIEIELLDYTSSAIIRGVRDLKLDIGLTIGIAPQTFEGLNSDELGTYGVHIAFNKKHRFSKFKTVPLSEIAKEKLVTFTRNEHPEALAALKKILSPVTDDPNVVMECDGISSLFTAVESGKGVALGFETMAKLAGSRLMVRPITPAPPRLPIVAIYQKNRLFPEALEFLTILKTVKLKSLKSSKSSLVV